MAPKKEKPYKLEPGSFHIKTANQTATTLGEYKAKQVTAKEPPRRALRSIEQMHPAKVRGPGESLC